MRRHSLALSNFDFHCYKATKRVEFCGYNVPHPLEDKILLRVQTRQGFNAKDILLKVPFHLDSSS